MTTELAAPPAPFFPAQLAVRRVQRISPTYVRIVLGGAGVHEAADNRFDQRIKIVLPGPGLAGLAERGGDWYQDWRALPEGIRPPMRTYTVREVRAAAGEIDVDIALHGDIGPGTAWATRAREGDEVVVVLPHAHHAGRGGGIDWTAPEGVGHVLLAGDETAAPAIAGILEMLPESTRGLAVLELPHAADAAVLAGRPPGVELLVVARGQRPVGEALVAAVTERAAGVVGRAARALPGQELADVDIDTTLLWEVPTASEQRVAELQTGSFAAWLAGEAAAIRTLRRHLVNDLGVDRRLVSFMGYWRQGRQEANG